MIIYHISDLHIRSGDAVKCRYDEYSFVFRRFVDILRSETSETSEISETSEVGKNKTNNNNNKACVVITGDLFHHKSKLESPGIKLFYDFVKDMADIVPVYVIRGNHDYKQWEANEVDLISSMLIPNISNVTYFNKTGLYTVDDVNFGLLAIQDVLKAGNANASVKADEAVQFPVPVPGEPGSNACVKVALFHGTPSGGASMFEGYDIALLGDNHLQHILGTAAANSFDVDKIRFNGNGAKTHFALGTYKFGKGKGTQSAGICCAAYAGSMIRQHVGEPAIGHGFLKWDVGTSGSGSVTAFHINNVVDIAKAEAEIASAMSLSGSLSKQRKEPVFNRDVVGGCNGCNGEVDVVGDSPGSQPSDTCNASDGDRARAKNNPESWAAYIKAQAAAQASSSININAIACTDLVLCPENLVIREIDVLGNPVIEAKVVDRNNRIKKKLEAYVDAGIGGIGSCGNNIGGSPCPFSILTVKWDWVLCYGPDNSFDFSGLDNKISTIGARNGHGKTSFLEVILLGLYGIGFPSRSNKSHSASIICNKKPDKAPCQITITLKIGSDDADAVDMVRVTRIFTRADDKTKLHASSKQTRVDVFNTTDGWVNAVSGKTAVDKWVSARIGSSDSFLLSCMVSQNADKDFFAMSAVEQKEMLDSALNIDAHTRFMELLKESKLSHMTVVDMLEAAMVPLAKQLHVGGSSSKPLQPLAPSSPSSNEVNELVESELALALALKSARIASSAGINSSSLQLKSKEYYQEITDTTEDVSEQEIEDAVFELQVLKRAATSKAMVKVTCDDFDKVHGLDGESEALVAFFEKEKVTSSLNGMPANAFAFASASACAFSEKVYQEANAANAARTMPMPLHATDPQPNCGLDAGPYNTRCKTCQERKGAYEARTKHEESMREHKALLHEYETLFRTRDVYLERRILELKLASLEEAEDNVASLKATRVHFQKAHGILRCYEDIVRAQRVTALTLEVDRVRRDTEQSSKTQESLDLLLQKKQEMDEKIKNIGDTMQIMESFVAFLYSDALIPLIERYTNEIIGLLEPNLKLGGRLVPLASAKAGFLFEWTLAMDAEGTGTGGECTGSECTTITAIPPIEKASGFQRFIAGLAIRIALGMAGATGTKPCQLFLDEGFTSCDSYNLAKVPDFMRTLLQLYDGIMLVTHLDDLKDIVDVTVQIQRDEERGLSKLVF
jgi:hypothetical protein